MRPPFALALCAGALLVTSAAGLFAEMQRGKVAAAGTSLEERAAIARELDALGWRAVATPASAALSAARDVAVLYPEAGLALSVGNATVSAEPPTRRAVLAVSALVEAELALYPASFLERIGLRHVVLCQHLREDGRAIPSLPNVRASLLIDVAGATPYLRHVLHHEIFHFADLARAGQLLSDPAWEALNPASFRYAGSGRSAREPERAWPSHFAPGFVSRYATSAVEEDKAELFALMLVAPRRAAELAAEDALIAAKSARVRELVEALGEVDEAFWERLRAVRND